MVSSTILLASGAVEVCFVSISWSYYDRLAFFTLAAAFFLPYTIVPLVLLVSMIMMYRNVSKLERRGMQKYGVRALRGGTLPSAPTDNSMNIDSIGLITILKHPRSGGSLQESNEHPSAGLSRLQWLLPHFCGGGGSDHCTKSNTMQSQKRAVLRTATGYVVAWSLGFVPLFFKIVGLQGNSIWVPLVALQGFYNFVVFMAPKVRTTRKLAIRGKEHLTWCQVLYKAYMSRGLRTTSISLGRRNRTNNTNMMVLGAGMKETIRQIFQLARFKRVMPFTRSIARSVLAKKKDSNNSSDESEGPHVASKGGAQGEECSSTDTTITPPHPHRNDVVLEIV